MKKKLWIVMAAGLFLAGMVGAANATLLISKINMDNYFEVYLSTADDVAGTQFGSGSNWPTTYVNTAALAKNTDYYLHVYGYDTGVIAGFLAQGYTPEDAVHLGVFLHGAAADHLSVHTGPFGYLATDVMNQLPHQIQKLYK